MSDTTEKLSAEEWERENAELRENVTFLATRVESLQRENAEKDGNLEMLENARRRQMQSIEAEFAELKEDLESEIANNAALRQDAERWRVVEPLLKVFNTDKRNLIYIKADGWAEGAFIATPADFADALIAQQAAPDSVGCKSLQDRRPLRDSDVADSPSTRANGPTPA